MMALMRIATWNVNSIRAREERLANWLKAQAPDVLCLQELKVTEADFPFAAVAALGYHAAAFGQKTYNGVAILSREEPQDIHRGMEDGVDDPQARLISARVQGIRVVSAYVPNGQTVGSEKWVYKLAWLGRLRSWLGAHLAPGEPFVLCGDFNVAPDDRDVARPEEWNDSVLCHPEVRAALGAVVGLGLEDLFRRHHAEGGFYSWWDYRELGFPKNNGLRIDHLYGNAALAARSTGAEIDRNERKGKLPSDHAPVIVELSS